jgi:hypothetical protein
MPKFGRDRTHSDGIGGCLHILFKSGNNSEAQMAFKPNFGRDRAERARVARAKIEEKQRKKDEKAALRKGTRVESESPSDETKS